MPSIRTDKQIFPFFDSVKSPLTAAGTSESFHNSGFSTMILEIANATAISAKVEACVNILKPNGEAMTDNECEWTQLAVIGMSDYAVSDSISDNGIYAIGINGTARVRVVVESVSGSAVITGVAEA